MKIKKTIILLSGFFIVFNFSLLNKPLYARDISICSFNIQFLGNSKVRDNQNLAELIKNYDIIVVQELVAPPYEGVYPDGKPFRPDLEAAAFFDEMTTRNFNYIMSEEDTGPGKKNHLNSNATEWWVVFYKSTSVKYASDLPSGFLSDDVTNNSDYDRVPYAFSFRTFDNKLDFVLISVHLRPGVGPIHRKRRSHELQLIHEWIYEHNATEKDFIILGDMNIENKTELENLELTNYTSLNIDCVRTNTLINRKAGKGAKPYDHIMYNVQYTQQDIDMTYGFKVIDLIEEMKQTWDGPGRYPGQPYNHNKFRKYYSDHHPVVFMMKSIRDDD